VWSVGALTLSLDKAFHWWKKTELVTINFGRYSYKSFVVTSGDVRIINHASWK